MFGTNVNELLILLCCNLKKHDELDMAFFNRSLLKVIWTQFLKRYEFLRQQNLHSLVPTMQLT